MQCQRKQPPPKMLRCVQWQERFFFGAGFSTLLGAGVDSVAAGAGAAGLSCGAAVVLTNRNSAAATSRAARISIPYKELAPPTRPPRPRRPPRALARSRNILAASHTTS